LKSQVWRSRAKRRSDRFAQPPKRLPGADSFAAEGTKYLMIANGAPLIASIGGIGQAWQIPELRQVFTVLVGHFSWGIVVAMLAWICFSRAALHQDPSPNLRRQATSAFFIGAALVMIDALIIIDAGQHILLLLGVPAVTWDQVVAWLIMLAIVAIVRGGIWLSRRIL
jgi:hypothetical protein